LIDEVNYTLKQMEKTLLMDCFNKINGYKLWL